ncbi:hypothetical protein KVR01_006212 [Diaporthe batatas]|uniref:uncharacterized protein n=1 Tax=Diaporthe batatas TaxID=748121 RepID=UPI001D043D19|nr:uncharacterized protein KVR01_006212 [Diaporthe batatas]KAG8164294.1 hypothetical protein KVR01_006212 [Diaporthe batatas]
MAYSYSSTTPDFQPFDDFHSWVDKNQTVGTDGRGNESEYITFEALKEYWQRARISSILNACSHVTPIQVPIDDILARFLRIFSTLAYISTTDSPKLFYIKKFVEKDIDDHNMLFDSKPPAFSDALDGRQTFNKFRCYQWLFSPVTLWPHRLQFRELLPESILPFRVEKDAIVLKEFDPSEMKYSFKNEVDTYISLENKVPKRIYKQQFLKYYGSFTKGDRGFIMLEYVEEGSLLDFFDRNQLPLERQELYGLWSSLIDLFTGLEYIHSLEQDPRSSIYGNIRCVHHDLKPANIFVFRKGATTAYDYQFKIGDFGMTSTALVKTPNKSIRTPAEPSTKMYGAPELSSRYAALEDIDYGALWEMDIWSFGCVLFECLVWMTCGSRGVQAFFQMRQKETDADLRLKDQGYSGCFHNGNDRNQAVDDMMKLVMERRRVFDDLSGAIGEIIMHDMLIANSKRRLDARTLRPRFERKLEAETRQPENLQTLDSPPLMSPIREQRPSQEDGDEKMPLVNIQAGNQIRQDIHAREGLGSPNSLIESSRSLPRPNRSRSSTEAGEILAWPASPASMEAPDREQAQASPSGPDQAHIIISPPMKPDSGAASALSDPNDMSHRTSIHNCQPVWEEKIAHDDRVTSPDSSHAVETVAAGGSGLGGHVEYALLKIPEVLRWIDRKKRSGAPPLPDYQRAMQEIDGREQIFVIDDSETMRQNHWDDVIDTVKALGYLVKHADPNGVELFVTSNPTRPRKSGAREISTLVRWLDNPERRYPGGPCNMESSLSSILDHVKSGLKKGPGFFQQTNRRGTSVYILTDAIWEGGTRKQCGVEDPIKDLVRKMQKLCKTRTTVALQFIQFGDDPLGKQRLQYLDDTLGKILDFDIVDHRHHERDGVWHMLLGSISRGVDQENDAEGQEAVT